MSVKEPRQKLKLYKALKIGYTRDLAKQQKQLKKYGYVIDKEISNPREEVIAYNPFERKLLWIENGTDATSLKDLASDAYLIAGSIKDTKRYDDAKAALNKVRLKYKLPDDKITFVAHSLGGQITNAVAPSSSKVINYNAAYTFGQKPRANVTNYHLKGDPISALIPRETRVDIENKKNNYLLKAHALENIKELPIYF
jgi:hypothetical protein